MILVRGTFRLLGCAFVAFLICQLPWWLLGTLAAIAALSLVPALGRL